MAKISLSEALERPYTVDRAKLDATTEEDIERHREEDGYGDLEIPHNAASIDSPASLRARLGLTQQEIADALAIPVGTWRNWEQGRVAMDPAATSLLSVVSRLPRQAFAAIAQARGGPSPHESLNERVREMRRQADALAARKRKRSA